MSTRDPGVTRGKNIRNSSEARRDGPRITVKTLHEDYVHGDIRGPGDLNATSDLNSNFGWCK